MSEIARICRTEGASWHESLSCEISNGSLRLLSTQSGSKPLITLPTKLLIPVKPQLWKHHTHSFEPLPEQITLEAIQTELLKLCVDLYNETEKLNWWNTLHPNRLFYISSDIRLIIQKLKPWFSLNAYQGSMVERFLSTRALVGPNGSNFLMPIVDCMNHHHCGAPIEFTNQSLSINAFYAEKTAECFAQYGQRRDVLDLVLHHGYFDQSTPYAHCCPLDMIVDGVGRIVIQAQMQSRPKERIDLPSVSFADDEIYISHLCFDLTNPRHSCEIPMLIIRSNLVQRGMSQQRAKKLAMDVLMAIADLNIGLLFRLAKLAGEIPHAGADIIVLGARRQIDIIKKVILGDTYVPLNRPRLA